MSPVPATSPARRAQLLDALGLTRWQLRPLQAPVDDGAVEHAAPQVACVVVLPGHATPRALDLLGRALLSCGPALARAPRIGVSDGRPGQPVPVARGYLVLGQAQARALGRELSAEVMHRAQISLAAEPDELLASGAAKRELWLALRQLRRVVVAGG